MSDAEIMNKLYTRELQEAVIGRQLTTEELKHLPESIQHIHANI